MKKQLLFILSVCSVLCANGQSVVRHAASGYDLDVTTTTAGTLSTLIPESERHTTNSIKVSGPLNGDDVIVLRDMAGVSSDDNETAGVTRTFNFADARFVAGGSSYGSYYDSNEWEDVTLTTEDNVFPAHFFSAGSQGGCEITDVVLPTSITAIGSTAFQNTADLTSIDIPANVTSIGDNAFAGSGLESIVIPANVEKIGSYAFWGCAHMTKAVLNNSPKTIAEGLFSQTAISSINIPSSVETIGSAAFHFCYSLASVTGGENVRSIGSYAFNYCKALTDIELSDSLQSIGGAAFNNCDSLQSIYIPAKVSYIANGGFYGAQFAGCHSLSAIDVDENNADYSSIDGILYNKEQTELMQCPAGYTGTDSDSLATVPEGVTKIDANAFDYCLGLTRLSLPSTLTEVGNSAFIRCAYLKRIDIAAVTPPSCGWENPFDYVDQANCLLYVPASSVADYKAADYWKDFNIQAASATGISSVSMNGGNASSVVARYSLSGARLSGSASHGIQIVRYADGSVRKLLK